MGLFDRFGRRSKDAKDAVSAKDAGPDVDEDDLDLWAQIAVLPGFTRRDDAVERVRERFELNADDPRPAAAVDKVWAERKAEESAWSGPSDYERLRLAFDELQADGVVARMNFTCCGTCGTAEIGAERTPVEAAKGDGFRESAYTFFHEQDAEELWETPATLFLNYGPFGGAAMEPDPAALAAVGATKESARTEVPPSAIKRVGERIAAALRRQGLDVTWDGDPDTRIAISITDWRKPLHD